MTGVPGAVREAAAEREAAVDRSLAAAGVQVGSVSTEDDLVRVIVRLAAERRRRRRSDRPVTFIWPPLLLTILLVPLGVLAAGRIADRRRARVAELSGLSGRPLRPRRAPRRVTGSSSSCRPRSRSARSASCASRWLVRRRPWPSRGSRGR